MGKCIACGKTVLLSSSFGDSHICNKCASTVNLSAWEKRDFESLEELLAQKDNAIQLATINGFSKASITAISEYFDTYINAGYVTLINGKAGQKLKVFADYCIVETKNNAKKSELVSFFCDYLSENDTATDNESALLVDNGKALVKGLLSGKLVQTGIGIAASTYFDSKEKEATAEKKAQERQRIAEQKIITGEHKINLNRISGVDIYNASNDRFGFLRFIPKRVSPQNYCACDYFFFNNSLLFGGKKIRQSISSICDMLNDRIPEIEKSTNSKKGSKDVFEEIRKFKALYDDGIISEQEFNEKKKRLLKL